MNFNQTASKIEENPQISLFRAAGFESRNKEHEKVKALLLGRDALRKRILLFGLSEEQAEKILSEKGDEFVRENLEVVEQAYQAGKVKNLPAYTLAALKSDYRPKKSQVETMDQQRKQSKKQAEERCQQEQQRLEQLRNEFEIRRLQEALSSMGSSERKAFEDRFQEKYSGDLVYKRFKEMGMDHPIIQSLFRAFASKELLEEVSDEEFTDYFQLERRGFFRKRIPLPWDDQYSKTPSILNKKHNTAIYKVRRSRSHKCALISS